jgi:site-specific recombinase XerD
MRADSHFTKFAILLGHANVSQTDTYLSAKIASLRESMKRFDAARGTRVAKPEGT